jgi:hypothetical protein
MFGTILIVIILSVLFASLPQRIQSYAASGEVGVILFLVAIPLVLGRI